MSISNWLFPSYFLGLSLVFSPSVFAIDGDTAQPVSIESNSGFYDDKKGVSIYTGMVIVMQGSMRMDADKVVVYMENREIQKLVATGTPVKFQQTPEEGKEDVHGKALTAEYYPETKLLIMVEEAVVWQGKNSTASERIEYDRIAEVVKAGSSGSDSKRVHVILQPKDGAGEQ
ncbi:MAG: lipopolysaccharide transport periplasmic protein LptA [Gammaproteobacteria bacterium]|jgi:lipopolysaccharide export system protein LptA|nr:lipopolysaccharide transport periplasmic protein LptA [Gammaproteobacteria bacterium]MBT5221880.1 lipopolysaccharide transport periplasmic protein LptA [Gammaproteobacteria bacterium]MBT5824906.1 lipopolysaccharide transport periplasmic protein LptA [Gammaproteobacteria bacterium]MBT5967314.1 lipopolysaccharide transport periplasmic protein LptA [Gammaproteobacteria bacterium]MBT6419081.1 lipopolysaccharide transport periplasmic protein LptA [Gammaproteobacteria bacterium]